MFFEKKVDTRSRQSMIDFLTGHFRYNTMSSWNGLTSYANRVKFHHLGLTKNQQDKAWDMLDVNFWDEISYPIDDFTREMSGYYTISSNGRSGGYLVLMNSRYELTGYKSRCRSCGQCNFTEATSDNNKCGRCHAEGDGGRVNYATPPRQLSVAGKEIDQGETFDSKDEWSMLMLRKRVELVRRFDRACDEIRDNFIALLDNCSIIEETIMVPQTHKVLQCAHTGGI